MAKFYVLMVSCGTQVGHVHNSRAAAFKKAESLIDELGERASTENMTWRTSMETRTLVIPQLPRGRLSIRWPVAAKSRRHGGMRGDATGE